MATSEINLPPGFEIVGDEQAANLPPGFELVNDNEDVKNVVPKQKDSVEGRVKKWLADRAYSVVNEAYTPRKLDSVQGIVSDLNPAKPQSGLMGLEGAGNKVKNAVQESISNIVSSPIASQYPTTKAVLGTAASLGTSFAPFTPSEFGGYVAGSIVNKLGPAYKAQQLEKSAIEKANRYYNAPASVYGPRLDKGKPTIGEASLRIPELTETNPIKQYHQAKQIMDSAESQIDDVLSRMDTQSSVPSGDPLMPGNPAKGDYVDLNEAKIAVRSVISEAQQFGDEVGSILKFLDNFLESRPRYVMPKDANIMRRMLDGAINRAWNRQNVGPNIEAMQNAANSIRIQLANKSPELAQLLNKQSTLFDTILSLRPAAGKGYLGRTSTESLIDLTKTPYRLYEKSFGVARDQFNRAQNAARQQTPNIGMSGALYRLLDEKSRSQGN